MAYDSKTNPRMAEKLCELGATEDDLAHAFDTSSEEIERWKQDHTAFWKACTSGRTLAHTRISNLLLKAANGYRLTRTKLVPVDGVPMQIQMEEDVPPSPQAAAVLLAHGRANFTELDVEEVRAKVFRDFARSLQGTALRPREE
jgi:hypothetical protein